MREGEFQREERKERREEGAEIADIFWKQPSAFVERAAGEHYAAHLRPFFEVFAALDDVTLPTEELRKTRGVARRVAE